MKEEGEGSSNREEVSLEEIVGYLAQAETMVSKLEEGQAVDAEVLRGLISTLQAQITKALGIEGVPLALSLMRLSTRIEDYETDRESVASEPQTEEERTDEVLTRFEQEFAPALAGIRSLIEDQKTMDIPVPRSTVRDSARSDLQPLVKDLVQQAALLDDLVQKQRLADRRSKAVEQIQELYDLVGDEEQADEGEQLVKELKTLTRDLTAKMGGVDFNPTAKYPDESGTKNAIETLERAVDSVKAVADVYRSQPESIRRALEIESEQIEPAEALLTKLNQRVEDLAQAVRQTELEKWQNELEVTHDQLGGLRTEVERPLPSSDENPQTQIDDLETAMQAAHVQVDPVDYHGNKADYVRDNYWRPAEARMTRLEEMGADYDKRMWIANLEATHNQLNALKLEFNLADPTHGINPAGQITNLNAAIERAHNQVDPFNYDGERASHINEHYWRPADEKLDGLRQVKVEFDGGTDISVWKTQVQSLIDTTDRVFKDLSNVERKELLKIQADLIDLHSQAVIDGHLELGGKAQVVGEEIEKLQERHRVATDRIENLIRPPVPNMTIRKLSDEILDDRMDPFYFKEWKASPAAKQRERDVINAFIRKAVDRVEDNPEQEVWRIVQKIRVQLKTLDAQIQVQDQKASRHRGDLFKELYQRIMTRRELLIATTYHPRWGSMVRDMIERAYKTAALLEGEVVVMRSGKERVIEEADLQTEETVLYRPKSGFTYSDLAGEHGQTVLDGWLNEGRYSDEKIGLSPADAALAREFASLLFTTFDLLTVSLRELQKRTRTRQHNGAIKDKDRCMFGDPLAAANHRAFRYGGSKEDWSLRILTFFKPLNGSFRFGKRDTRDHEWLSELQKTLVAEANVFFPTNSFAYKIDLPGFCETIGIDTTNLLRLGAEDQSPRGAEKLWVIDHMVVGTDGQRNDDLQEEDKYVTDITLFEVAEQGGFGELLELTFKGIGGASKDQILSETEEGGKGGLIGQWFQTAGRAKMFPGEHLKLFLEPLLANFVLRLFQSFDHRTTEPLLIELWEGIVRELRTSRDGGLDGYKPQLTRIINSLHKKPVERCVWGFNPKKGKEDWIVTRTGAKAEMAWACRPKEDWRSRQRENYLEGWFLFDQFGKTDHPHPAPDTIFGVRKPNIGRMVGNFFRGSNAVEDDYMAMMRREKPIPIVAKRTGDMIQPVDESKN